MNKAKQDVTAVQAESVAERFTDAEVYNNKQKCGAIGLILTS